MTLRKQGTCKDCGNPVYGDDYGPGGHQCKKANLKLSEVDGYEQVFDNCNVCGRKLNYVQEDKLGLCRNCQGES